MYGHFYQQLYQTPTWCIQKTFQVSACLNIYMAHLPSAREMLELLSYRNVYGEQNLHNSMAGHWSEMVSLLKTYELFIVVLSGQSSNMPVLFGIPLTPFHCAKSWNKSNGALQRSFYLTSPKNIRKKLIPVLNSGNRDLSSKQHLFWGWSVPLSNTRRSTVVILRNS